MEIYVCCRCGLGHRTLMSDITMWESGLTVRGHQPRGRWQWCRASQHLSTDAVCCRPGALTVHSLHEAGRVTPVGRRDGRWLRLRREFVLRFFTKRLLCTSSNNRILFVQTSKQSKS